MPNEVIEDNDEYRTLADMQNLTDVGAIVVNLHPEYIADHDPHNVLRSTQYGSPPAAW